MLLSVPPTQLTIERAENYLESSGTPPTDPVSVSWKTILDEEPFEGQHWEGVYGLPPGSTVEGWETRSLDSTPPYSPLLLDGFGDFSPSLSSADSLPALEAELSLNVRAHSAHMTALSTFGHRQLVEDLQRRQYWRTEWRPDASLRFSFAITDASSLGMLSSFHSLKNLADPFTQDRQPIEYWVSRIRCIPVIHTELSVKSFS
jgi:gamma-tubulin complex component 5